MSSDEEDNVNGGDSDPATKKRKVQRACDLCRRKKVRCDGAQMTGNRCSNCVSTSIECTYISEAKKRGPPKGYVESLEKRLEKMEDLLLKLAPGMDIEAQLVEQASNISTTSHLHSVRTHDKLQTVSQSVRPRNVPGGSPRSEVTLLKDYASSRFNDCKLYTDDPLDYETSDDEVGAAQLPDVITDAMQNLSITPAVLSRFHGKSSSLMLIRAASDLKRERGGTDNTVRRRAEFWTPADWEWDLMDDTTPSKSVEFPPEDLTQSLFELFFRNLSPFVPIVHRPSFEAQYADGLHLRHTSFAIVVLLVCAIASRYSDDPRVYLKDAGPPSAGWKYFVQVKDLKRSLHAPATLADLQTYALVAYYLQATSAPHSAWTIIGIGIRCAQDIGVHRKKVYKGSISLQEEQWKRVFWCLIMLDRSVSSSLGRPLACQDEDFDIDFPEEIDDEYWVNPGEGGPKQPEGVPSIISFFNASLKLCQILAFALRTIYTINKSKVLLGFVGPQWEQHIVAELDSAMNKWLDAVPDHLRWDPNREHEIHFEQSAVLYASYYHLHILIHRPFIPSPKKPTMLSFPSLAICTNAARSCSHVIESLGKRAVHVPPFSLVAAFTSGIVLLISIWGAKKTGVSVDQKIHIRDVEKCLAFLEQSENDWHYAGRLVDILRELASFGELPLRSEYSNPVKSHKRDRDVNQKSVGSSGDGSLESHSPESERPRKPMPKPRQASAAQSLYMAAQYSAPSESSNGLFTGQGIPQEWTPSAYPTTMPTSSRGIYRPAVSQWHGPTGGLTPSSVNGQLHSYPDQPSDGSIAEALASNFYQQPSPSSFQGASSSLSAQTRSSSLPSTSASSTDWSVTSPMNGTLPYGLGHVVDGAPTTEGAEALLHGYQGIDSSMALAADSQAFLGDDELNMWQSVPPGFELEDWSQYLSSMSAVAPTFQPPPL